MMRFALRDDAVRLARSCGSPCAIMRCAAPGTLVYLELYALCGALQSVTCAVTRDAASRDGFFQSVFAGVRCSWLQVGLAALLRLFPLRQPVSGRVRCGGLAGLRICWVPLAAAPGAARFVAVSHGIIRGLRTFCGTTRLADAVQSQSFPPSLVGTWMCFSGRDPRGRWPMGFSVLTSG
ncbi:hypothetical protein PAPYR_7594 [Paratrimastix pyriformis]|uniref:Uncharacterized protein n=1 Tax=Paratrimastix pyriformis TaxID=342808 RepID=A0ABQ8UIF1_9EUKA|nr:hypothetical protein PAPYR_7594 [Paratrimastix pyriformis]